MQRKFLGDSSESLDLNIPSFRRRYCFFYGTLVDPSTLAKVLGINHRPLMRPATVTGYTCKLWGQYPALVDGPPAETVSGVAYDTQSQDEEMELEAYEGDSYALEGILNLHSHRGVLLQLLKSKELEGDNINRINQEDNSGTTPLRRAASGEIASELIKAGADKNAKENSGRTPLHYAAVHTRKETGSELIEAGTDKDGYGRTPLHMASLASHIQNVDFVEFLLSSGAMETPNLPPEFKIKRNYITLRKHKREKMNSG
ncbi:MAG: hypothetical protein M1840_002639 [Geoglossum simile]|nr:MAG: hypothetical protein M1840_002639 [Geoglossum simile]